MFSLQLLLILIMFILIVCMIYNNAIYVQNNYSVKSIVWSKKYDICIQKYSSIEAESRKANIYIMYMYII